MQDNFFRFERLAQRLEIDTSQRIDDEVVVAASVDCGRHTNLEQTKFLAVRMQAVRLGVDGNAIGIANFLERLSQLGLARNKIQWQ